jgi:hypothetical protein
MKTSHSHATTERVQPLHVVDYLPHATNDQAQRLSPKFRLPLRLARLAFGRLA